MRPILKSCLAPSRHHLPTLWCQMLLVFTSYSRISEHTQQPSVELSPPPPSSQLFCHLSSSYSNTEMQFAWVSAALLQFDYISSWASFLFCDIILISQISPASCNVTIPGQSCLESCGLFPSSLIHKLYLPAPKDFVKLTNKLPTQKLGGFNTSFHDSRISQER